MRLYMVILAAALYAVFSPDVMSQMKILSREKVESVTNPRLSADSSSFMFQTKHIVAEPMTEDDGPETFVFPFRNISKEMIHIDRLVTTCSCVSATVADDDVPSGASSEIRVRYNPEGHPGKFERRIFVYADGKSDPAAVLRLTVDVGSGKDISADWPVRMGMIGLRRSGLTFVKGKKAVEKIRFINLGKKSLHLDCEKAFLPDCLTFDCEPSVVPAGAEGVMVISYDPSKGIERPNASVILKGLGLPPTRSSIKVVFSDAVEND